MPATTLTQGTTIESIALVRSVFTDRGYERTFGVAVPFKAVGMENWEDVGDFKIFPSVSFRIGESKDGATPVVVRLDVDVIETKADRYFAAAGYAGTFKIGEASPLSPNDFVRNAVVYLVPFVRQHLAHLTSDASYDVVLLPPLNVEAILHAAHVPLSETTQAVADIKMDQLVEVAAGQS